MKATILIILLTSGCIVSAYPQMNQKRNGDVADSLSRFHYDMKAGVNYKKLSKPDGLPDHKTAGAFLSDDGQYTSMIQGRGPVQESMPCYKPEGVFSMRIIEADTTIGYTMFIKRY